MSEITFVNRLGDALEAAARRDLAAQAPARRWWLPVRSLPAFLWVIVPLLLIAAAGAGAYAANSSVRDLFQKVWPGVENSGQVHEYDLSQTIDGMTIRLERAYADSNVVVIGLSTSGMPEEVAESLRIMGDFGSSLKTADGTTLRTMRSFSAPPGSDVWGDPSSSQETRLVRGFDASGVTDGDPDALDLELTIFVPRRPGVSSIDDLVGPFTFNFTVPMYSGDYAVESIVEVGMTVEDDGTPITLERLMITPGETRAILHFPEGLPERLGIVQLNTPLIRSSGEPNVVATTMSDQGDGRTYEAHFYHSLVDDPGRWILTIGYQYMDQSQRGRTWVFEFTVPPVGWNALNGEVDVSPGTVAEANGGEVRLERVVMTPAETRATVWIERNSVYASIAADGVTITTIKAPDGQIWSSERSRSLSSDDAGHTRTYSFFMEVAPQRGTWELRINRVKDSAPWNLKEWPASDLIGDPWVLTFDVE